MHERGPRLANSTQNNMSQFFDVCKVSDIPMGEARMFEVNEVMIGVFHQAGQFFAMDNACPHAGASLSHGIIEGDVVRCRIHHWRFCIRNGTYLDEKKPKFNIRTYQVRVLDERIQIAMEDNRS